MPDEERISKAGRPLAFPASAGVVEMLDEPAYSLGSRDNSRAYPREIDLGGSFAPSSKHGVRFMIEDEQVASVLVAASGGATGVHEASCLVRDGSCVVAVGDQIVALALPTLEPLWHVQADPATCFGLYAIPATLDVISHGELEIRRFGRDGGILWSFSGPDIFTGEFSVQGDVLSAVDFNGDHFWVELQSGMLRT